MKTIIQLLALPKQAGTRSRVREKSIFVKNSTGGERAKFLLDSIKPKRKTRIVDVGANPLGQPLYKDLINLNAVRLWAFEPNEEAFQQLEGHQSDNSMYLPYAVGKPGKATFYSHHISALSSLFRFRKHAASYLGKPHWIENEVREVEMELVSLDSLPEIPKTDILKLDVQGSEVDVISGAEKTLSNAVVVIPEVAFYQLYEGQPLFADIDTELRKQGFICHKLLPMHCVVLPNSQRQRFNKSRMRNQIMDGDAIYIRNLDDPSKLSAEALKHLALAADSIFRSFDLCVVCLDQLVDRGLIAKNVPKSYADRLPKNLMRN